MLVIILRCILIVRKMRNNIVKSMLFILSLMSSITYATSNEYFEPGRTIFLDTKNVPDWSDNGHYPYMYLFHNTNGSKEWIRMEKCGDYCFEGVVPNIGGGEPNIMD